MAGRISLVLALIWAGGLASIPGPGWLRLALAAGLAVTIVRADPGAWARAQAVAPSGVRRWTRAAALALILAVLARTLARTVIDTPAALWALAVVLPVALFAPRFTSRSGGDQPRRALAAVAVAAVTLTLTAGVAGGLVGPRFEAAGGQARGAVSSGPIIGVHPRQAVSVHIDGFGPHDLVTDDYVDIPGGLGYDPETWATWLETELREIAATHYAEGPARARQAFARAEVEVREALVPPAELARFSSVLGVEVRSGTTGEGSRVVFVCPGQPLGPTRPGIESPSLRACPRKYVVDGSTGLGLAARFAGYTEVRGRPRGRLARALSWPSGDPKLDRRHLAVESGLWLLALVLVLVSAVGLRGRGGAAGDSETPRRSRGLSQASAAFAGLALALACLAWGAGFGRAGAPDSSAAGPGLLALLLLLPRAGCGSTGVEIFRVQPRDGWSWRAPALVVVVLAGVILLAAPLGGRGEVLAVHAGLADALALALPAAPLGWETASAIVASLAVVLLTGGLASATREAHHTWSWPEIGLAVAAAGLLALRKPEQDPALLGGAVALLLVSTLDLRTRTPARILGLVGAIAALSPVLLGETRGIVGPGLLAVLALACLLVPWTGDPGRSEDSERKAI